ncbi:MAG: TonB family protein [Bacteroidota bacterium]|nr:TonB family protein [Bacteroidota bacterium]MDX5431641.1 TonB family protein [Bacteroidota bacterium]MDX5470359.1 TonB family protein [Bacteroidota bacterium]
MNRLLIFFLLLVPFSLSAQKTKKVKVTNKALNTIEIYRVLKSDQSIKHGPYTRKNLKKKTLEQGYYVQGVKEGEWMTFDIYSYNLASKGQYKNDEPVGVWNYYDFKGDLVQQINLETGELILGGPTAPIAPMKKIKDGDTTEVLLDHYPIYLGGEATLMYHVSNTLEYPPLARENNIQGRVVVSFTVDEKGEMVDVKIDKGIGWGCDEAALKAVKNLPNRWIPATSEGKPVRVRYNLPLRFVLG